MKWRSNAVVLQFHTIWFISGIVHILHTRYVISSTTDNNVECIKRCPIIDYKYTIFIYIYYNKVGA